MARKIRFFLENVAQYIYLQGVNQKDVFIDVEDYEYYENLLKQSVEIFHVKLHAFSLSKNSIHLLATFHTQEATARFMQTLGVKYVSYFNKKYNRTGTLWEGRYKNSLVEDKWILPVMRYIDVFLYLNKYNSYAHNFLGYSMEFITEHQMYKLLGASVEDRVSIYQKLCSSTSENEKNFLETCFTRQFPIGDIEFYKKIEAITGCEPFLKKRGRPKSNTYKREKMYKKLVALDKKKHASLKVSPLQDLKFAKDMNFIRIAINEALNIGENFPIVFTTENNNPALVALVSLGKGNLAINEEGKYITRYIPAYLKRYPFSFAKIDDKSKERVILIDEEASVVNKTRGKQLFTKNGEESETLKNVISFLKNYDMELHRTAVIVEEINKAGILENREISIGEGENKKVLIKGFKVINREKMNKLSDKVLADWVRRGIVSFIDAHIKSLDKVDLLFKLESNRMQQRKAFEG